MAVYRRNQPPNTRLVQRVLLPSALLFVLNLANLAWADAETETTTSAEPVKYVDQWGPAIGEQAPELVVKDIDGNIRNVQGLSGKEGLVIFFIRSTSW